MQRLTAFNFVGGAGKSYVVREVGYALARHYDKRVLLIDTDPQSTLSESLGVMDAPLDRTVYHAAAHEAPLPEPIEVHGMHLIPSSIELAELEVILPGNPGGILNLRLALDAIDEYDYVLIDSGPSLGQLSALACIAADRLIVPVPVNWKGIKGLATVDAMAKKYRKLSPALAVGLYVPTVYDSRTQHARAVLEALQAQLTPLASPMSYRPMVNDAQAAGEPVGLFAPNSPADHEIRRTAQELVTAVEGARVH
ncbi:ParA family protein [Deinococcus yavapaiensis]|uniref:Chromosome partitioning protein n=1 Tax=Deinococcus yavapaiensis KR-236 TaxID=694435 RepID=A0A318S3G7_9DEIO|nr:ParA family protein [Deinococcus yavapaiensis]PYE50559.1 chromosome partitioning protein [Deinococcus yavapaiensis KR-236]